MKASIQDTLNHLQSFYVFLSTVTLVLSYFGDSYFFKMSIVSCLIKKIIDILSSIQYHWQKCSKEMVKDILVSIIGFNCFNENSSINSRVSVAATYLFVIYQDLLLWNSVLSIQKQKDLQLIDRTIPASNNHELLFTNEVDIPEQVQYFYYTNQLQIAQLILGLVLKAFTALYILAPVGPVGINNLEKETIFSLFPIFFWIGSLQGLFSFLFYNSESLWIIISIKVVSVIIHLLIASYFQLQFFGCVPKKVGQIAIIGGIVELLNAPIDYAPLYNKKWIQDFKQVQMTTQTSIHLFKFFQTIQLSVSVALNVILIQNLRLEQMSIFERSSKCYIKISSKVYFLLFFLVLGIISIIITIKHLFSIASQLIMHNYRFFKKEVLQLEELIQVLEKSNNLTYLEISSISNKRLLKSDPQLQKRLLQGIIKHLPKSADDSQFFMIKNFIKILYSTPPLIVVQNLEHFGNGFLQILADYNSEIPLIVFENNNEIYYEDTIKSIIMRIFVEGITTRMRELISHNLRFGHSRGINEGKKILQKFEKEIFSLIAFQRSIFPLLQTNPNQVLHDLQFNEKQKRRFIDK